MSVSREAGTGESCVGGGGGNSREAGLRGAAGFLGCGDVRKGMPEVVDRFGNPCYRGLRIRM